MEDYAACRIGTARRWSGLEGRARMDRRDPEAIRRRARQKILIGVGLLLVVVAITFVIAPFYYR